MGQRIALARTLAIDVDTAMLNVTTEPVPGPVIGVARLSNQPIGHARPTPDARAAWPIHCRDTLRTALAVSRNGAP